MTKLARFTYRLIAEIIFWIHVFAGVVLVFFWEFKPLYPYYLAVLLIAVADNTLLDFCFLAKWECYFRKKLDPGLNFQTFFDFYMKKFFGLNFNPKSLHKIILITLWCLLAINVFYWIYTYARIYS
jgi:hypothetical protein